MGRSTTEEPRSGRPIHILEPGEGAGDLAADARQNIGTDLSVDEARERPADSAGNTRPPSVSHGFDVAAGSAPRKESEGRYRAGGFAVRIRAIVSSSLRWSSTRPKRA